MKVGKLGWLVAMFLSGGMAVAQGTADDYRRAYALKEKFSADKVFYSNVNPQWIEGTHQFWYVRNTPDGCPMLCREILFLVQMYHFNKVKL